jgi:hypothetical protein
MLTRQILSMKSARFFCCALATALLVLLPGQSLSFQSRKVPQLRHLISTILSGSSGEGHEGASSSELGLLVVDFDMASAHDDLTVAAGWLWTDARHFQYFAGLGTHFPDPHPVDVENREESDPGLPALTLGAWMGAGARWSPALRLRLTFEARWTPADMTIAGQDEDAAQLQTGLSLAYAW